MLKTMRDVKIVHSVNLVKYFNDSKDYKTFLMALFIIDIIQIQSKSSVVETDKSVFKSKSYAMKLRTWTLAIVVVLDL